MNAYVSLNTIKSSSVLNIIGSGDDARLLKLLENVSRQVDAYCNRHFFVRTATKLFDGNGSRTLLVPDLVSVNPSGMKTDEDRDRTFETTWSSSDFMLYPSNADPAGGHDASGPYTKVIVDADAGMRRAFPAGRRTARIKGQWGYSRLLWTAKGYVEEVLDATETDVTLKTISGVSVGHTLLVGSEQMYVLSSVGNTLTVARGVNGTSRSSHAYFSKVSVFDYPGPIVEAVIVQVSRLWSRRDSDQWSVAGGPYGFVSAAGGLDPDVRQLLSPYRKLVTGVA